jgi:enoyl-CoA hydratase/carnithine racemase
MNGAKDASNGHGGVLLRIDDENVRTLRINRPERRNAMGREVIQRLIDELIEAEQSPDVRVIIITGTGTQAFCAGGDLKEMSEGDVDGRPRQLKQKVSIEPSPPILFDLMSRMETPIIAALNGHARGGGLELALACDLRIASNEATFGQPEAQRGLGAAYATIMLPRVIPAVHALEMLYTGRAIDAEEAYRIGLVNRIVAPHEVQDAALKLAKEIAANAPMSIRRMRVNFWKTMGLPLEVALHLDLGPDPFSSQDRIEGALAFVEGRPPQWKNA